jgi:hypothetical protein
MIHFLFETSWFSFCNFVLEIGYNRVQSPRMLMTSMKLKPPSDDRLDLTNTTVEEGQNSQMNKNRDISQKNTLWFFPFLMWTGRKSTLLGLLDPDD